MGLVNWLKKTEQQGIGQGVLDVTMGVVDRVRSGEGGPTPTLRFIRSYGLSGSSIANALKTAEPVIGSEEITLFWSAWLLRFAPSAGWRPLQHAQGGAASVVHCVRTADRVLILSNAGELLFELRPDPTRAPQPALVNEVIFGIAPVDTARKKALEENPLERAMDGAMEKVRARLGVSGLSPAAIYKLVAKERSQTDKRAAPKDFEEYAGAVVTIPEAGERPTLQLVVLASELDGILGALSG